MRPIYHKGSFLALIIFLFVRINSLDAQHFIPEFGKQELLVGFKRDLAGEIIPYYSSSPYFAKDALLTRCTDGKKTITWETADAPLELDRDYYYFYWLSGHSSGTSTADRKFILQINGEDFITFTTPAKKKPPVTWSFSGKDSVAVVFRAIKTDIHKDLFGETYLRVPKKLLAPGRPMTLSITGNADNSNDWFMIFRYQYNEKILASATPLLVQTVNGIKQILELFIDHIFSGEDTMRFMVNGKIITVPVSEGFNDIRIPLDTVTEPKTISIVACAGTRYSKEIRIVQHPVSRREVDIIHHSHNDIGYSHLQDEVMKIQYRNILDALDMIDRTDGYPPGSRFVWNEETLWPVEYFLKHAGEKDKQRFIRAVQDHRIVLSGFYAGVMTGLCSATELTWICEYADTLRKQYGLPINTAMLSDIPGISWSMTDAMIVNGLKYLSNGPNYSPDMPDHGDRIGGTIRELGDKPFYWKTTDGKKKVLVWTAGRGYNNFHMIPPAELGDKIREKLVSYLNELDSTGYPYDMVQLRYTIKSDNGPVDSSLCNYVREWNSNYVSPKLMISDVGQMMQEFERRYGKALPVLSGDFTPYWEDGAYSTAAEEGNNRLLSDRVLQLQKLSEVMPGKHPDPEWFYEARKNVVMFHEHTWGAWNSISTPDDPFTIAQWNYKRSFIDSAWKYIHKIESVLIPENNNHSVLTVYNTSSWIRSGYVETKIPGSAIGNALVDESGEFIQIQVLKNGKLCFIAKNIPVCGSKKYRLTTLPEKETIPGMDLDVKTDNATGAFKSLRYRGREWVSNKNFRGLNQLFYVKGLTPSDRTTSVLRNIALEEDGIIVKTATCAATIDGAYNLTSLFCLFPGLDYIKLSCIIDKRPVREKEAMHIVFPFKIPDPTDRIGISDTFFVPGKGQIPGANKDYYSVQRWLDISNSRCGVTICSPQCALFEIGSMTDERPLNQGFRRWKDKAEVSSTVFLYALNNYWNTNFKADQQGPIRVDCYLMFHDAFDQVKSERFGEEIHEPLIAVWE